VSLNIVKKIKATANGDYSQYLATGKATTTGTLFPKECTSWRSGGKRRRASAGGTAAQALEAQRRKRHELEGRRLGIPGFETTGEETKNQPSMLQCGSTSRGRDP
jgi:hypothetical protein